MNSKERMQKTIQILKKEHKHLKPALNYSNVWELLVSVILSAQCTDVRVNIVTKDLFKKYKIIEEYANADLKELRQVVRSTGFYRNKAKNIKATAQIVLKEFNGKVPSTMEELLTLKGVARKTANIVLGNWFGKNIGIAVDTHVMRLSQRLDFSKHKDPKKIEQDLMQLVPKKDWTNITHLLIFHGRKICVARKPKCNECSLNKICPSAFKV
ncbi:MAG: endonuclease III [archaeon]|nr:endonuclease III [archaeon]